MPAAELLISTKPVAAGQLPLADGVLLATQGGSGSDPAARLAHCSPPGARFPSRR